MTAFDILFFGLIIGLVLVIAAEVWIMHRTPRHDEPEPWIQLRSEEEDRTHRP